MSHLNKTPCLDPNPRLDPEVIGSFESSGEALKWVMSVRDAMWEVCSSVTDPPSPQHVRDLWGEGQRILEEREAAASQEWGASAVPMSAIDLPSGVGEVITEEVTV